MKHIWSVLCQKSAIDCDSNQISLFNCLEEMQLTLNKTDISLSEEKKIIPIGFHLIGFWGIEKEDKKLEIKIEILDPNKKILESLESKFDMQKGSVRFRSRVIFDKTPITTQGRYIFKIWQKNKSKNKYELVSELPLDVKILYKLNTYKRR